MTKYISIEDMLDNKTYKIEEKYQLYYKGKRIGLNHDEYNSISGARRGIKNFYDLYLSHNFPNIPIKDALNEVYQLIEIRKVTF